MNDPRIEELAQILVNYSLAVQPGEWVMLAGGIGALPLLNSAARYVLQAGGFYDLVLDSERIGETFYEQASPSQLSWISPAELLRFEKVDAIAYIAAVDNTRAYAGIDPAKQQRHNQARASLIQLRNRRVVEENLRWVYTEFPCAAYAQDADLSLPAFERFAYAACYADQPGGVERCRSVYAADDRRAAALNGSRKVEVRGEHVDLSLSIAGRTFVNAAGRRNMPDGEIFTGPVEDSVNGWIRFGFPAIYAGREVDGVELRFENGRVAEAKAAKNEAFLHKMLETDAGARYLGEFAIGTNENIQRFTRRILYDEKIGGTIHLAIGNGYPETGSQNRSGVHWDFICDMRQGGEIRVDGEVIYLDGRFVE